MKTLWCHSCAFNAYNVYLKVQNDLMRMLYKSVVNKRETFQKRSFPEVLMFESETKQQANKKDPGFVVCSC